MDHGEFDAPFWTFEQTLSWILTRSREVAGLNSGEALAAALSARAHEIELDPTDQAASPICLRERLDQDPEARELYRWISRRLLYALKRGSKPIQTWGTREDGDGWPSIDRMYWLDHVIEPDHDGRLRDSLSDGCYTPGYGNYRKIRVDREAVLSEWQDSLQREHQSARAPTKRAETCAYHYLCEEMRISRETPTVKAKAREEAKLRCPGLGRRAFDRAWSKAAEEVAPAWSEGGRRKKSPQ